MFRRSAAFVEAWLAELTVKPAATAAAVAVSSPAATITAPVVAAKAPAATDAAPAKAPAAPRGGAKAPVAPVAEGTDMSKVQLLVGRVLSVAKHPDSAHLWVEQIDLGEAQPRQILSGLQAHVTAEEFTNRLVVVAANLEPRKLGGVPSAGMVLCASDEAHTVVKLLDVPAGAVPGERIVFPGHAGEPEPVLKKKLVKHWEAVAPELKTDASGVATYAGLPFVTSTGPVTCTAMPSARIS